MLFLQICIVMVLIYTLYKYHGYRAVTDDTLKYFSKAIVNFCIGINACDQYDLPHDKIVNFWHKFVFNIHLGLKTRLLVAQVEGMKPLIQGVVQSIMKRPSKTENKEMHLGSQHICMISTIIYKQNQKYFFLMATPRSPTRSLCGPTSKEFQFQEFGEPQFVNPSWCFDVRTTYLQEK